MEPTGGGCQIWTAFLATGQTKTNTKQWHQASVSHFISRNDTVTVYVIKKLHLQRGLHDPGQLSNTTDEEPLACRVVVFTVIPPCCHVLSFVFKEASHSLVLARLDKPPPTSFVSCSDQMLLDSNLDQVGFRENELLPRCHFNCWTIIWYIRSWTNRWGVTPLLISTALHCMLVVALVPSSLGSKVGILRQALATTNNHSSKLSITLGSGVEVELEILGLTVLAWDL